VTTSDIRVLIVDDHPVVRTTLAEAFSGEDGITVVGQCEGGAQVAEAAARLQPDVITMDLSMPGVDGLAATEALRAATTGVRVVVLSAGAPARHAIAAAGADALVPKNVRLEALLTCVRAVVADGADCPYCL
jgi:DNA-binding NarL/FixJ family response regulator